MRVVQHPGFNSYYFDTKYSTTGFSCQKRPWFNLGFHVQLSYSYFEVSINLPFINPYFVFDWNRGRKFVITKYKEFKYDRYKKRTQRND